MINLLINVIDTRLKRGEHADQFKLTFYYELGELECKFFADVDVEEDNTYHSDVYDTEYGYCINVRNVQVDEKSIFSGHSGECTLLLTDQMKEQVASLGAEMINQVKIETFFKELI